MEGIGAEVSQKIRSAIKAKLMEIGVYVDEELPDYVMVMVANKRSKDQMDDDLQLFLGKHTSLFTTWLHQVLQKLQKVTVANIGIKRKLPEDSKKKKKSKYNPERKETKKKIKLEPEDDTNKNLSNIANAKDKKDYNIEEESNSLSSSQFDEIIEPNLKEKTDTKFVGEKNKKTTHTKKNNTQLNEIPSNTTEVKKSEEFVVGRSKSRSTSSHTEDLDDEDCINIRTDGELLDTTEDVNIEEYPKEEIKGLFSSNTTDKETEKTHTTYQQSPTRQKSLSKSIEPNDVVKLGHKEKSKKQSLPHQSQPLINEKVVDARELLNRKKAAKQPDNRVRAESRDKSISPPRKRRDCEKDNNSRSYSNDKDVNRRVLRDDERESSTHRVTRDDDWERRGIRDRDSHSSKRRGQDRTSHRSDLVRADLRDSLRRESNNESVSKRGKLEKPFRNKNEDWDSARSSKSFRVSESRRIEIESSVKRREFEEPRKRSGLVSRVVPRSQERENDVETPVPSVVKVTPRPRRPPSQQPSSTLIIKAISEANKSLANVPQRPDSTQRTRKDPVFTRTLRQLERIPPEKIAVSISNPLALKNTENLEEKDERNSTSSPNEETTSNKSLPNNQVEVTSSEPDNSAQNEINPNEEWDKEEKRKEESEMQEPELELVPTPDLETFEEPMEESSDPQFVVTLNGYDPDGLYSQGELDLGLEGDGDDWLKENLDEEPLLTSTPDEVESPRPKRERNASPIVIMNTTPAVNHNNLIEVELVKTKTAERCKFWPACRLEDKCTYYHPSKPCKLFPACKFGDSCLYIHPQCKYNALCTRKDCVFAHTPVHTPSQPAAVPKAKALYAASAQLPCKFYPNCANINCQFAHPPRACRFGSYCTKKDCSFDHGQVAPVDKLKWTRVPTTT